MYMSLFYLAILAFALAAYLWLRRRRNKANQRL